MFQTGEGSGVDKSGTIQKPPGKISLARLPKESGGSLT